ncbi:MAG TPA: carbonic anhydrase family protein [Saprospiraceae bacterium]|nr:carbonic anhydrase family protein [Saprospiraceae bacterium]
MKKESNLSQNLFGKLAMQTSLKQMCFLFIFCMASISLMAQDHKADTKSLPSCTGIHWEYDGDHGADHWASLCVDYTACGGRVQSPVNIKGAIESPKLTDISKNYSKSTTHIVNNGHTQQFNYDAGSSIMVNGEKYNLLQFHTHTPSEHTINGKSYPMEIHFVHKNDATGKLAVIGILVSEGAENATLKSMVEHLPAKKDGVYDSRDTYTASDLMSNGNNYFTYSGSLTTPPCSEIVTWLVMENPIIASKAQIHDFEELEHHNNRPIQAINTRSIQHHTGATVSTSKTTHTATTRRNIVTKGKK